MRIVLGLGVAQEFVPAMLGWVVWLHNQARTSAADAQNAEVTQPLPEPARLMRTMLGLGTPAKTSAAADAHDAAFSWCCSSC